MTDAYGCSCKGTFHSGDCFAASHSPEMPAPGYDAQTIPVALTTDQLEDAKLGRAMREFVEAANGGFDWAIENFPTDDSDGYLVTWYRGIDPDDGTEHEAPTLLAALTAARRELEERS